MSRLVKIVNNKYVQIEEYKNPNICFNTNEYDNFEDYCTLRETFDPFEIFYENQELKLELSGYRQAILEDKEMLGLKEENDKLKKQLENKYEKVGTLTSELLYEENTKLINQQKEFINYLENGIDICDGFLDTVKSDLQEILYGVISANENITTRIIENETAHKIYEEILQKYKSIIGVLDENNIK